MKGRWLLVGLVVSLALNLFLVGLGVGALVFGKGRPGEGPPAAGQDGPRRGPLWMASRGLSEQHRPAYRRVVVEATLATREDLREARRLKRRGIEAMAAERYDPEAAAADLEKARALEFKARSRIEHDIARFAATLPPAERAALSEALGAAMFRRGPGRLPQDREAGPPPPFAPAPGE